MDSDGTNITTNDRNWLKSIKKYFCFAFPSGEKYAFPPCGISSQLGCSENGSDVGTLHIRHLLTATKLTAYATLPQG